MERFRFGEQEGPNGKKTTLNGFLAVFGAGERCHLETAGPNGGVRAMAVFDKATARKVGAALLEWAGAYDDLEISALIAEQKATMPGRIQAGEGFIPRFVGDFPGNPKGREQTQKDNFKWARENGYEN